MLFRLLWSALRRHERISLAVTTTVVGQESRDAYNVVCEPNEPSPLQVAAVQYKDWFESQFLPYSVLPLLRHDKFLENLNRSSKQMG